MKINWKYMTMVLAVGLLSACEVIPENEQITEVFTPTDPSAIKRTSVLIEYSGWQCVNCPTAAEEAHHLKEQYGENLVVVVMHPESNPNTRHNNKPQLNYTCPEADSLYIMMGGTNTTPFPTGNVNLVKDATKGYFNDYDKWATLVSQAYSTPKPVIIGQEVKGTTDSKDITITIDITNAGSEMIDATLQVWLTEDNVIGSQKKPEGTDKNYAHNHLMRASISPLWGDAVRLEAQQKEQLTYHYTLPENVVKENCNIVALVSVNGEVIQAKETKVGS
ncbi:MAG: Omp28 family outer membrane lipoprotein [Paludibacteraceae bacterium]|nr:Omp28 family outer membrane lipoprotein [Paludibacteraceae bacterium]